MFSGFLQEVKGRERGIWGQGIYFPGSFLWCCHRLLCPSAEGPCSCLDGPLHTPLFLSFSVMASSPSPFPFGGGDSSATTISHGSPIPTHPFGINSSVAKTSSNFPNLSISSVSVLGGQEDLDWYRKFKTSLREGASIVLSFIGLCIVIFLGTLGTGHLSKF